MSDEKIEGILRRSKILILILLIIYIFLGLVFGFSGVNYILTILFFLCLFLLIFFGILILLLIFFAGLTWLILSTWNWIFNGEFKVD